MGRVSTQPPRHPCAAARPGGTSSRPTRKPAIWPAWVTWGRRRACGTDLLPYRVVFEPYAGDHHEAVRCDELRVPGNDLAGLPGAQEIQREAQDHAHGLA